MKSQNFIKLMLALTALVLLIATLTGCYTEKKATKQAVKAINVYPLKMLPIFRGQYPCVDVNKADTVIVNTDTTIWVDCPDTIPASQYFTLHDTIVRKVQLPAKTIRVPVTLPVKTVTIVKEIEDLSRIVEKDIQLAELQKKIDELQNKNDKKGKAIKWLIFFLIGLSIPYILKAIKFFKP